MMRRIGITVTTAATLAVFLAGGPAADEASDEGIAIKFEVKPLSDSGKSPALQEGEDVVVRFCVSDTTGDAPISGAYPAAWIDRLDEGADHV